MYEMASGQTKTDCGRSWLVAACCCFCNLTFYGVSRLSGIMLVAATHAFQVSRARAALPFSLSTAIRNLAGVFVGQLGHRFGVGPVVTVGCIVASLGSGLCFFAQDMQWVTICWGGLFGAGFGLATCLLPLAINQHFAKHNGTASGISYSGSYIGSFIFPPVVVWLLDYYGFQGTFLIISGGVLHVSLAAIFLGTTKPPSQRKASSSGSEKNGKKENNSRFDAVLNSDVEKYGSTLTDAAEKGSCRGHTKDVEKKMSKILYNSKTVDLRSLELYSPLSCGISGCYSELSTGMRCAQCNDPGIKPDVQNVDASAIVNEIGKTPMAITSGVHVSAPFGIESNSEQMRNTYLIPRYNRINSYQNLGVKEFRKDSRKFSVSSKPLSKTKQLKAKYKFKLKKLKKVLVNSLFGNIKDNSEHVISNDAQLLSFRYYQSFPGCPKPNSIDVTPREDVGVRKRSLSWAKSNDPNPLDPPKQANDIHDVGSQYVRRDSTCFKSRDCKNSLAQYAKNVRPTNCIYEAEKRNSCVQCESCTETGYTPTSQNENVSVCVSKTACDASCSCSIPMSHVPSPFASVHRAEDSQSLNSTANSCAPRACLSEWLCMFSEPMFIVISFTMSIHTFIVVCVVTTIEDYAKDIGISESKGHYSLMALSTANLVGTLTLGAVTDREFISRHRFLSLCFLGMTLSLAAVSMVAVSLPSLLAVLVLYGLLESGIIITFPILTKQFVKGEERQAIAIASSNVLSAPTVMLVPILIGHYRDNIGCYSGLFHLLAATSFVCSLVWLVVPFLCQRWSASKKNKLDSLTRTVKNKCEN